MVSPSSLARASAAKPDANNLVTHNHSNLLQLGAERETLLDMPLTRSKKFVVSPKECETRSRAATLWAGASTILCPQPRVPCHQTNKLGLIPYPMANHRAFHPSATLCAFARLSGSQVTLIKPRQDALFQSTSRLGNLDHF